MSTPKLPQIVKLKIANNQIVADPPTVTVVAEQIYFEFELHIAGLKFAETNGVQVPSQFTASFLGPWRDASSTRISLLDVCNTAGDVYYMVNVVNSAGNRYQLVFPQRPKIINQLTQ